MYMSSPSERMESVVCVVLYLLCVLCVSGRELIFTKKRTEGENVTVNLGSHVTFSCWNSRSGRTTWYKDRKTAAFVIKSDKDCKLHNKDYLSISAGQCTNNYTGITLNRIQYTDSGSWSCTIYNNSNYPISSQSVYVDVKENVETTQSPRTRRTTTLQHYSPTVLPSKGPISDMTTTPAENEPITDDQSEVPNGKLNMTAVIGGAVGGLIGLVLIITIVAVLRKTRTHSRDKKKPTNAYRTEGRAGGQHNDFGAFEEDIGGQYAAISDTNNPTPAKVVAENPMYESYGQEDGGDHVPDVYSVVQKPLKSQSSTNDGSKDPNQPVTEDNVADVYSVVQKPSKLQESGSVSDGTKDTQPSGSDEMGDVYSVVQKPAKG